MLFRSEYRCKTLRRKIWKVFQSHDFGGKSSSFSLVVRSRTAIRATIAAFGIDCPAAIFETHPCEIPAASARSICVMPRAVISRATFAARFAVACSIVIVGDCVFMSSIYQPEYTCQSDSAAAGLATFHKLGTVARTEELS